MSLSFDKDPLVRFRRIGVQIILLYFVTVIPVIASVGPAVDGIVTGNSEALLLAVVGVLGAIVALLGGIVAFVKAWVGRMEPRIPRAGAVAEDAGYLIGRNTVDIGQLTRDVQALKEAIELQGRQIDQARRTSETNMSLILKKGSEYQNSLLDLIKTISKDLSIHEARLVDLERSSEEV
jgi:hypothetical protein